MQSAKRFLLKVLPFFCLFVSIIIGAKLYAEIYVNKGSGIITDSSGKDANNGDTAVQNIDNPIRGYKITFTKNSLNSSSIMNDFIENTSDYYGKTLFYSVSNGEMTGNKYHESFTLSINKNNTQWTASYDLNLKNIPSSKVISSSNYPNLYNVMSGVGFNHDLSQTKIYNALNSIDYAMEDSTRKPTLFKEIKDFTNFKAGDEVYVVIEPMFYIGAKENNTTSGSYGYMTATTYYKGLVEYMVSAGNSNYTSANKYYARYVAINKASASRGYLWVENCIKPIASGLYPDGLNNHDSDYGGMGVQKSTFASSESDTKVTIYYRDINSTSTNLSNKAEFTVKEKDLGSKLDVSSYIKTKINTSGKEYAFVGYKIDNTVVTPAYKEATTPKSSIDVKATPTNIQIAKGKENIIYYYYEEQFDPVTLTIQYLDDSTSSTLLSSTTLKVSYGKTIKITKEEYNKINNYELIKYSLDGGSKSTSFPVSIKMDKNKTIKLYYQKAEKISYQIIARHEKGQAIKCFAYASGRIFDNSRSTVVYNYKSIYGTGYIYKAAKSIGSDGNITIDSDYFQNFVGYDDYLDSSSFIYEYAYIGKMSLNQGTKYAVTNTAKTDLTLNPIKTLNNNNVANVKTENDIDIYFNGNYARRIFYMGANTETDLGTAYNSSYTSYASNTAYKKFYTIDSESGKVTANRYIILGMSSTPGTEKYLTKAILSKFNFLMRTLKADFSGNSTYYGKTVSVVDTTFSKSEKYFSYNESTDKKTFTSGKYYSVKKKGFINIHGITSDSSSGDGKSGTTSNYYINASNSYSYTLASNCNKVVLFYAIAGTSSDTDTEQTITTPAPCLAKLTLNNFNASTNNSYMNYMDYYNGNGYVYPSFTFSGSASATCGESVSTTIAYSINNDYSNTRQGTTVSDSVYIGASDIQGDAPYSLYVPASGTFTASISSDTKSSDKEVLSKVTLTNNPPYANFSVATDLCGTESVRSINGVYIGYSGIDMKFRDYSTDAEDDWIYKKWSVSYNGTLMAYVYESDYNQYNVSYVNKDYIYKATVEDGVFYFNGKAIGQYVVTLDVLDGFGASSSKSATVQVGGKVSSPIADISGLKAAFVGINIPLASQSIDANNDINYWAWNIFKLNDNSGIVKWTSTLANQTGVGNNANAKGTISFLEKGYYVVSLTVRDETYPCTKQDDVSVIIKAVGCTVIADISTSSSDNTIKENRKLTINTSNAITPDYAPVIDNRTKYIITPLDGQNISNIKIDTNNGNAVTTSGTSAISVGSRSIDTLFKQTGQYKVTVIMHNTCTDTLRTKISASDIQNIESGNGNSTGQEASEYYDSLMDTSNLTIPTDYDDFSASVRTIIINVTDDEIPDLDIFTTNANPNFIDNPNFINLAITAETNSPDSDIVRKYDWILTKDKNEDGVFNQASEKTYSVTGYDNQSNGANTKNVTVPVYFEQGINGKYQATLNIKEEFGQTTIDKFVTDSDRRTNSTSKTFLVDWVPSISINLADYYYVDDVVSSTVTIKDEKPAEDKAIVVYNIYKQNPDTSQYELIQTTKRNQTSKVWETTYNQTSVSYSQTHIIRTNETIYDYQVVDGFANPTGTVNQSVFSLNFSSNGNYRVVATITDVVGQTSSCVKNFRIYDLPTAVVSDFSEYRFAYDGSNPMFQTKQNRRFDLTGVNSYTKDLFGENTASNGTINHEKDYLIITPLSGQSVSSIKMKDGTVGTVINSSNSIRFEVKNNNLLSDQFLFKEIGTYQVDYQVTNNAGKKSALTSTSRRNIVVLEDKAPDISFNVNEKFYKGAQGTKTSLVVSEFYVHSYDYDNITINDNNNVKFYLIHDTNNNGSFDDETKTLVAVKKVSEIEGSVDIQVDKLGNYKLIAEVVESYGQPTIAEFVDLSYKNPVTTNVDRKYDYYEGITKLDNVEPSVTFGLTTKSKVDVVFASGNNSQSAKYEGNMVSFENALNKASNNIDAVVEKVETGKISMEGVTNWIHVDHSGSELTDAGWSGIRYNTATSTIEFSGYNSSAFLDYWYFDNSDASSSNKIKISFSVNEANTQAHSSLYNGFFFGTSGSSTTNGMELRLYVGGGLYVYKNGVQIAQLTKNGIYNSFSIEFNKDTVSISVNGVVQYQASSLNLAGTNFGPEAQYNSHGCTQITRADFINVVMEVDNTKSISESTSNVSWRPDSNRFVVWVEDNVPAELKWVTLTDKTSTAYKESRAAYLQTISLLQSSNINLIVLGSNTNLTLMKDNILNNLIVLNDPIVSSKNNMYSGGIWYDKAMIVGNGVSGSRTDGGDIITAMNDASAYIVELMKQSRKTSMYVLVGDEVIYDISYSDSNGDPSYLMTSLNRNSETEKWYYSQRENFYKNALGTIDDNKVWRQGPYTVFTKTGLYKVNLKMRDNPLNFNSNSVPLENANNTIFDTSGNPTTTDGGKVLYTTADGSSLSYWWGLGAITNISNLKKGVTTTYDNTLSHNFGEYRYWSTNYDIVDSSAGGVTAATINGITKELSLTGFSAESTTSQEIVSTLALSSILSDSAITTLSIDENTDNIAVIPNSTNNYVVGVPIPLSSRVFSAKDSIVTTVETPAVAGGVFTNGYTAIDNEVNGKTLETYIVSPLENDETLQENVYSEIKSVNSVENCEAEISSYGNKQKIQISTNNSTAGLANVNFTIRVYSRVYNDVTESYDITELDEIISNINLTLEKKLPADNNNAKYQSVEDVINATAGDKISINPFENDIYNSDEVEPIIWSIDNVSNCDYEISEEDSNKIIITSDEDTYGEAYIIYTIYVYDGSDVGTTVTGKITLNLAKKNFKPIANTDTIIIDEDTVLNLDILANDYTKYNDLKIIKVSNPMISGTYEKVEDYDDDDTSVINGYRFTERQPKTISGAVQINSDNTVTFTPDYNFNSKLTSEDQYISFNYTIQEEDGDKDTATVYIIVNPVNDIAEAQDDTFETQEDTSMVFDVLMNDSLGDGTVTITIGDYDSAVGTLTVTADNKILYNPKEDYNGTFTFTYEIKDNYGDEEKSKASVEVNVIAVKDMPTLQEDKAITIEDESIDIYVTLNDLLGETDSIELYQVTNVNGGTVEIKTDENGVKYAKFAPKANLNGNDIASFNYSVKDNDGDITSGGKCVISITPVDDNPIANSDIVNATEDTQATFNISTLLSNDIDYDTISSLNHPVTDSIRLISVVGSDCQTRIIKDNTVVTVTKSNNVKISGDTIIYTPAENFNGQDYFYYTIEDSTGLQSTAKVTVNVAPVNDAPIAKSDSYQVVMNSQAIILDVTANDLDVDTNDTLTLLASKIKSNNGVNNINSSISVFYDSSDGRYKIRYTPEEDYDGVDKFTYTIIDSSGVESNIVQITINVKIPGDTEIDNMARIYVHRVPIASFITKVTKANDRIQTISITSDSSYDLDHQNHLDASKSDNHLDRLSCTRSVEGVRAWEWTIQVLEDTNFKQVKEFDMANYGNSATSAKEAGINWMNQTLATYINGNSLRTEYSYTLKLRVRDIDGFKSLGAWSSYYSQLVTANPLKPIAIFDLTSTQVELETETTSIIDKSYDPNGDNIIKWVFTLKNGAGNIVDTSTVTSYNNIKNVTTQFINTIKNIHNNGSGYSDVEDTTYSISLLVTDDSPSQLVSNPYTVSFTVYPTNHTPSITLSSFPHVYYEADSSDPDGRTASLTNDYWGDPDFTNFFNITDPESSKETATQNKGFTVTWKFENQLTKSPYLYDESKSPYKVFSFTNNYSTPTITTKQEPFTGTVTNNNLTAGVYKITMTVTDKVNTPPYKSGSALSTSASTTSYTNPLHMYVIPKVEIKSFEYQHVESGIWNQDKTDSRNTFAKDYTDDDLKIMPGDTVRFYVNTNSYSTSTLLYYLNPTTNNYEYQQMSLSTTNSSGITWVSDLKIADGIEDVSNLNIKIETRTNYGGLGSHSMYNTTINDGEYYNRRKGASTTLSILTVKLYDFAITNITDNKIKFTSPQYVPDLAYDKNNNINKVLMKKGYSFDFELKSKGLKNDNDYVRVIPKFYAYNSLTGKYDKELDMYYLNDNNEYILSTSTSSKNTMNIFWRGNEGINLGKLYQLNLPISLRTAYTSSAQLWKGRYIVPGTAQFVYTGQELTKETRYIGEVLITFDIDAMKSGSPKFNYIAKKQWQKERTNTNGSFINPLKAIYSDGSVIVIDGINSIEDDYEARPVWKK